MGGVLFEKGRTRLLDQTVRVRWGSQKSDIHWLSARRAGPQPVVSVVPGVLSRKKLPERFLIQNG